LGKLNWKLNLTALEGMDPTSAPGVWDKGVIERSKWDDDGVFSADPAYNKLAMQVLLLLE
jgi:hypothetical protein